jgi:hypothetical protein
VSNIEHIRARLGGIQGYDAAARSPAIAIHEPVQNHIRVRPGKMTEAQYLADVVTRQIYQRSAEPLISQRPCDVFSAQLERVAEHAV